MAPVKSEVCLLPACTAGFLATLQDVLEDDVDADDEAATLEPVLLPACKETRDNAPVNVGATTRGG